MDTIGTSRDENKSRYLDALGLIERLHRRLLDLIKIELDRVGRHDVNSVQALLLYNIGDAELTAGELRTRGYYLGSNVSYNLKKLVAAGYVDHQRSTADRRAVRIRLTMAGNDVRGLVDRVFDAHVAVLARDGELDGRALAQLIAGLRRLERFWYDTPLPR